MCIGYLAVQEVLFDFPKVVILVFHGSGTSSSLRQLFRYLPACPIHAVSSDSMIGSFAEHEREPLSC